MKSLSWKLGLMAGVSCLALFGTTPPVLAADNNPPGPDEHIQQLERRLNELANRQEQMMQRLAAPPDARGQMGGRFNRIVQNAAGAGVRPEGQGPCCWRDRILRQG